MPMDLTYGTYQPDELMPLIPSLFVPGTFLTRAFFPRIFEFESKVVYFDRVLADRRRAPLVAPLAPGRVQQPRGYRMESLEPASFKPKNQVDPNVVMDRLAGEALGGEMSATDRATAIREHYLLGHQEKLARSSEWMASSILRTGAVILSAPDYPATTVNFQRTGSLTKTLLTTDRWGESGVSPYDDVEEWINEVGTASGSAANIVSMDRFAWSLYAADPKTEKALDRTLGQTAALTLGLTPTVPGAPVFKGRIGDVEFYVYNDIGEDPDGNAEQLVPDYTVMVASQGGILGGQLFGLVQHAENKYKKGRFFPHNWIDPNTGAEWIETISSPILAAGRIDATLCATVR